MFPSEAISRGERPKGDFMSAREDVVRIAKEEAANKVSWTNNESRILEYFKTSTGKTWTKGEALKISWCTYFVHWVLVQAKMVPMVAVGVPDALKAVGGSVGRFIKSRGGVFDSQPATGVYSPRAGDLYYLPKPNDHVGIIIGVEAGKIYTVDGDSGPPDMTKANDPEKRFAEYELVKGKSIIGGGMIFRPPTPKKLNRDEFYILLPGP